MNAFLHLTALSLIPGAFLSAQDLPTTERDRPNFVVILADDMAWDDLGPFGNKKVHTPNLDRLRSQGMSFTDAHSTSAVCSPTRYGLLTGRYSWRTTMKSGIVPNLWFHSWLSCKPIAIDTGAWF